MISLEIQTLNSQPQPVRFSPKKTQPQTQHLYTSTQLKIHCSSLSNKYPDTPKIPKKTIQL